mmetsp:Transcript_84191/g.168593  ORF Transcript_84191/g.168593 Transcript_84191/m.168593 type:complete len:246 (+) Transcript_84191:317-1054(+)
MPPWVQEWDKWKGGNSKRMVNNEDGHAVLPSTIAIWIARDPIERYISAFYSKFACCDDGVGVNHRSANRPPRNSCFDDVRYRMNVDSSASKELLELANMPPLPPDSAKCLPFFDFVRALSAVHAAKSQRSLDIHVYPQHLSCGHVLNHRIGLVGGLSFAIGVMNSLRNFGFRAVKEQNLHHFNHTTPERALFMDYHGAVPSPSLTYRANETETKEVVRLLCALSLPEYKALGWQQPASCKHVFIN